MPFSYPDPLLAPFAYNGDKAQIPMSAEAIGYASLTEGFPVATQQPLAVGGVPPRRVDFNGILNIMSQWVVWAQNGGIAVWDAGRNYQLPCMVGFDGVLYWGLAKSGPDFGGSVEPGSNAEVWEIVGEGSGGSIIGKIDLMPFRAADLPTGWHICNGGGFATTSAQGKALATLPANFKTDWKITTSGSTIYKPNLLTGGAVSGQGPFFRPSNSVPGTVVGDAIRNITGEWGWAPNAVQVHNVAILAGAFYKIPSTVQMGSLNGSGSSGGGSLGFDARKVIPTAAENRPLSVAMTPAIWLGC